MLIKVDEELDVRIQNARIVFVPTKEENDERRIMLLAKSIHYVLNEYCEIPPDVVEYMRRMCSL